MSKPKECRKPGRSDGSGSQRPAADGKPGTGSARMPKRLRADKLYSRVTRATAALLKRQEVVSSVDLLVEMGMLDRKRVENWRRGRVPYLERVISGSLPRLGRLLRIWRAHAAELGLAPAHVGYPRKLRYSKTGDPNIERAYASCFRRRKHVRDRNLPTIESGK